jgi:cupin superfamily acireductone dioxygenase involved in methionine salvage
MNGYYVINLNGKSHWTCLLKDGKHFYYFDSFGFPASEEVEEQIGDYIYSDVDIQNIKSTSCGYFCVVWMKYMQEHKHKDKEICFSSFLKLFSKDSKKNETILHNLLNNN